MRTNVFFEKKRVFLIENVSKKFNFTIRKQLKITNNIISQFITSIRINDYKITIVINSNVLTNFMSTNFVNKKLLFIRSKNDNYFFVTINDKTLLKKTK